MKNKKTKDQKFFNEKRIFSKLTKLNKLLKDIQHYMLKIYAKFTAHHLSTVWSETFSQTVPHFYYLVPHFDERVPEQLCIRF